MKRGLDDRSLKPSIITVFHPNSAFTWNSPGDGRLYVHSKFYGFSELKEEWTPVDDKRWVSHIALTAHFLLRDCVHCFQSFFYYFNSTWQPLSRASKPPPSIWLDEKKTKANSQMGCALFADLFKPPLPMLIVCVLTLFTFTSDWHRQFIVEKNCLGQKHRWNLNRGRNMIQWASETIYMDFVLAREAKIFLKWA